MNFSHLDENGRARMVDVSGKPETARTAIACVMVEFEKEVFNKIINEGVSKGDIFAVAKVAAIMASKKTSELIPLCHPVFLNVCDIRFDLDHEKSAIRIYSLARTRETTGVEMEAIVSVNIAAITIYDMCKALSKKIKINRCSLLYKSGGKSAVFKNDEITAGDLKVISEWIEPV